MVLPKPNLGRTGTSPNLNMPRPALLTFLLAAVVARADDSTFDAATTDVRPGVDHRVILHVCDPDGTPLRPLVGDVDVRNRWGRQGGTSVSGDGRLVAFEAFPSDTPRNIPGSHIFVVDFDGTNVRDLGDGTAASISPDGTRIAYSRLGPAAARDGARSSGTSIWMQDLVTEEKFLLVDDGGFAPHWSPDGQTIAYTGGPDPDTGGSHNGFYSDNQGVIRLFDVATGATRNAYPAGQSPFGSIYFAFGWATDGTRRIVFGGRKTDVAEELVAVIDVDAGIESLRTVRTHPPDGDVRIMGPMIFTPDHRSVLLISETGGWKRQTEISLADGQIRRVLPGPPPETNAIDPAYTPDGRHLILSLAGGKTW